MTYYYTYKITCLKGSFKDHYYYGQHHTKNFDDGYCGCGTLLRNYYKKYGAIEGETYIKDILCYYNNIEELNKAEFELIGDNYATDIMCLNLRASGNQKGFSQPTRNLISEALKGKSKTDEHKYKLSIAAKKQFEDPIQKQHIIESNIKRKGQKWVSNDIDEKLVWPNELEYYINNGWKLGRISGKTWINNGTIEKHVYNNCLDEFIKSGWHIGRKNKNKVA